MNVIRFIVRTLQQTPLVFPGLVVAAIVAALVAGSLATWTGLRRLPAALLLFSFGAILAITLAPSLGAGSSSSFYCDVRLSDPPPVAQLVSLTSDDGLNVLLFVPLGCFIGLIPRARPLAVAALGAVLVPFVVEGIQYVFPELGRACQAWDVVENLLGLAIGVAVGLIVSRGLALVSRTA